WLYVRKTGANTEWVARQLAIHAAVPVRDLSYAGMKDRNAITEQWYSIHLPGKSDPDWSTVDIEGVEILHTARHTRKLKRGALKGNRFDIGITSLTGDNAEIENRLIAIKQGGVPNYFGVQRFGRDGQNLVQAEQLFKGKLNKIPRHKRGLYLSTARSALFNLILAGRVADESWSRLMLGDVLQLDGRSACFVAEDKDSALPARIESMDVHLTGPMWGRGELMTQNAAREYEITNLEADECFRKGLEQAGLKQERRSLRIQANQLDWQWHEDGSLRVQFSLPPGAYATSVLRELCQSESAS
ncbi:MAG: tRNA pseudouridine(13) synthase TruD, partial [Gammaproteobacteria bacterium]